MLLFVSFSVRISEENNILAAKENSMLDQGQQMLLSSTDISHTMPHLSQFSNPSDEMYGIAEERRQWEGDIDEYYVEIILERKPLLLKWGARAFIQSEDGVVLDRVEVLPRYDNVEDIYVTLCEKLDKRITKLQSSHITRSFPFIGK